ncbi:hypothetical protein C8J56DRAFT_937569 [Mycena floridula]|nr:hypothetical protein C8J56DRAFT_937569 [Mycena floridula]
MNPSIARLALFVFALSHAAALVVAAPVSEPRSLSVEARAFSMKGLMNKAKETYKDPKFKQAIKDPKLKSAVMSIFGKAKGKAPPAEAAEAEILRRAHFLDHSGILAPGELADGFDDGDLEFWDSDLFDDESESFEFASYRPSPHHYNLD